MTTLDDIATIIAAVSATVAALVGARNQRHLGEVKQIVNGNQDTVQRQNNQLTDALVNAGVAVPQPPASEPSGAGGA